MGAATLHLGDCRDVLKTIADRSIDAIVTDPPYEIGFMGRDWDRSGVANDVAVWAECLRVLKPGGHLLAFSGARTYHRMACAIEDAGFELRDQIMWIYGSGFPKSKNLDGDWNGWGTALKPAHEPICVARKPLVGTVEANVLAHGTGALNIDACRIETDDNLNGGAYAREGARAVSQSLHSDSGMNQTGKTTGREFVQPLGRWPANVIHDGSNVVLAAFPDALGQIADANTDQNRIKNRHAYGQMRAGEASADRRYTDIGSTNFAAKPGVRRFDTGSAARFFYCAKASRADRNDGVGGSDVPAVETNATMRERERADWPARNGNHHPTVKPTDLMAYLCRLVTPPGGTVLDPFMGSGSTGKACVRERFGFVGIDLALEYIEIARARIEHELSRVAAAVAEREALARQRDLFADAEPATACASAYGLCE
ncbi:site-specific DNA-methyltransferase [Burkholderia cenocepacia]|nr:site-specific DNA-methyltransferase [Burkholderia cenocepacia]MCW3510490.1 site-specific DNA-methyltransferase [Burkholderia cenocepacia]MCW3518197.1 site-specific DNA-methyltransferase [Burkholderia cenocepacia]MCW3533524.1 site-specific DNA-methyltransferase [Burkholderia cenocepacia]MCW3548805.1 site-specific DNA-methyltransferase [Burkholderia cenocepacia]